jgi:diguanylate cyclase (GGDEF)-like protein
MQRDMNTIPLSAHASPAPAVIAKAGAPRRWRERAADLILSTERRQRRYLTLLLLAGLITLCCIGLMVYGSLMAIFDPASVAVLAVLSAATMLGFYGYIRSGRNQRCADPTLALPQTIAAQTLIAGTYAITGPVHPGILIMLAVVMVFGMFNLRAGAVRVVCAYTLLTMGAVMTWGWRTDPLQYPAHLEVFYFILLAIALPVISTLSGQLMGMRTRLKTHKLELEKALAQIQHMAVCDELTQLPNRRCMLDLLRQHALRRERGGASFYVGMIDLDHFKQVNDSHGHAAGDEVLRCFAGHAASVLRTTDCIGRWGGEEFLVLLSETPPGDPTVGISRLRSTLARAEVCAAAPRLRVAFSSGFARYEPGEPIEQTIERADRALYAAKAAGRGRTVVL